MSRQRSGGGEGLPWRPLFVEGSADLAPAPRDPSPARPSEPEASPEPARPPRGGLPPFRHLAREAADVLGVARVGLWALEEDGGLVCLTRFHRDTLKQEDDRRYPEELGRSFGFLLERAAVLVLNDTRTSRGTSGPFHEWLRQEGIRSLLALPVRVRGRLAGWITFEEEGEPRRWDDGDRSRALPFAGQLGGVLAWWQPDKHVERSGNGTGSGRPPRGDALSPRGDALSPRGDAPSPPGDAPSPPGDALPPPTAEEEPIERSAASPKARRGRRELQGRVRSLPALEGAALLGGESAGELLHLLEIQSGYLALLDEVVRDDPEDRELVDEARSAGERVRDGLLTFLESLREGIPAREPLDLTEFLAGISARLARLSGDDVRLRLAPASEILRVEGNPRLLERAMSHLVGNARDASPPGSGIRISWGRWKAPDGTGPEIARIVVEDQGRGIPPQDLPWVFEPFYSAGAPAGRESSGKGVAPGLGLPVVQAVVEGHGGWVDVRSRPGEGTQVALHLPLFVPQGEASEASTDEASVGPERTAAPRILVVEDEPMLARLLDRILTRSGFRVTVVEAAEDADQAWRSLDGEVDLAIVERVLTGERSGLALTASWRQEDPALPVMVLDRKAAPRDGEQEAPGEIEGFPLLTRPFQPADVVGAVRRCLAASSDSDEAAPGRTGESRGGGPDGPGGIVLH